MGLREEREEERKICVLERSGECVQLVIQMDTPVRECKLTKTADKAAGCF